MKNQVSSGNPSTFQELISFRNILSGSKYSEKPLLKKTESTLRLVYHLEKQLLNKD